CRNRPRGAGRPPIFRVERTQPAAPPRRRGRAGTSIPAPVRPWPDSGRAYPTFLSHAALRAALSTTAGKRIGLLRRAVRTFCDSRGRLQIERRTLVQNLPGQSARHWGETRVTGLVEPADHLRRVRNRAVHAREQVGVDR